MAKIYQYVTRVSNVRPAGFRIRVDFDAKRATIKELPSDSLERTDYNAPFTALDESEASIESKDDWMDDDDDDYDDDDDVASSDEPVDESPVDDDASNREFDEDGLVIEKFVEVLFGPHGDAVLFLLPKCETESGDAEPESPDPEIKSPDPETESPDPETESGDAEPDAAESGDAAEAQRETDAAESGDADEAQREPKTESETGVNVYDYIFVGKSVTGFQLEHPIDKLCSPAGHEGILFPYAVDERGAIIILDEASRTPWFTRMTNLPPDFSDYAYLSDDDSDDESLLSEKEESPKSSDAKSTRRRSSNAESDYSYYDFPPEDTKIYCLYECTRHTPGFWGVRTTQIPFTTTIPLLPAE